MLSFCYARLNVFKVRAFPLYVPLPVGGRSSGSHWDQPILACHLPFLPAVPLHRHCWPSTWRCHWSSITRSMSAAPGHRCAYALFLCLFFRPAGLGHVLLWEPPEASLSADHQKRNHGQKCLHPVFCCQTIWCRGTVYRTFPLLLVDLILFKNDSDKRHLYEYLSDFEQHRRRHLVYGELYLAEVKLHTSTLLFISRTWRSFASDFVLTIWLKWLRHQPSVKLTETCWKGSSSEQAIVEPSGTKSFSQLLLFYF